VSFAPAARLGSDVYKAFECACYGAQLDRKTGTYRAHPATAATAIQELTRAGFTMDIGPGVPEAIDASAKKRAQAVAEARARTAQLDARLRREGGEVFRHQAEGIEWLADRADRGALFADDMGLGKTVQSQLALPPNARVLVISPAGLKAVWMEECEKWRPDYRPVVLEGSDGWRWPSPGEMLVVNYEILPTSSIELKHRLVGALNGEETATGLMKNLADRARAVNMPSEAEELLRLKTLQSEEAAQARGALIALQEAFLRRAPFTTTAPLRQALVDALNGATVEMQVLAMQVEQADLDQDSFHRIAADSALFHPLASPARSILGPLRDALEREATAPAMLILADEAHKLGNRKSQRAMRVKALVEATRRAGGAGWAITGTPLRSTPDQLWNVLATVGIDREFVCDYSELVRLFGATVGPRGGVRDWGDGKKVSPEVPERLRRIELRRTKKQLDLPPITYRTVIADIDPQTAKQADEALEALAEKGVSVEEAVEELAKNNLSFRQITRACTAMAKAKIPTLVRLVEDLEAQGEPVVAFSAYLAPVEVLGDRPGWAVLAGSVPAGTRKRIQDRFQAGGLRGIAATIDAGGVGITLTRAAHLILSDRKFVPADNDQARDRIHRIGQKRPCTIYYIVARHALDMKIAAILDRKAGIIAASVDAAAVEHVELPEAVDWDTLEREAAEAAAEAREAARRGEIERARQQREKVRSYVVMAAARRLRLSPEPSRTAPRGAETPEERWAAAGIVRVAGDDPDRARYRNDVGFNAADGRLGHALAFLLGGDEPKLTDQSWRLAVDLAHSYERQIGAPPRQGALATEAAA
jgi:hypothetical protein